MEMLSKVSLAFQTGGMWMWVILALQIVSIAIIIERAIVLYLKRKTSEVEFANGFEVDIRKGNLQAVKQRALQSLSTHPLAAAIVNGVDAAMNLGGREEIQGKMDEILIKENAVLERRTGFLAMLANVGTLTGLLGTIVGMIKSFSAVSDASPVEKATLLSAGISEAMNTTAYGLIMAIPALILFAVLTNRATQISEDLNQGALKVFNWLNYSNQTVPVRTQDVK